MSKPSQLERAIQSIESEIEVLQAALARLKQQREQQTAKKAAVTS